MFMSVFFFSFFSFLFSFCLILLDPIVLMKKSDLSIPVTSSEERKGLKKRTEKKEKSKKEDWSTCSKQNKLNHVHLFLSFFPIQTNC